MLTKQQTKSIKMEENNAKIYLKMGEIEFSIEGSPEYVTKQYNEMQKRLNLRERLTGETNTSTSQKSSSSKRTRTTTTKKKKSLQSTTQDFSKWLEKLPERVKNGDKILVAGYYVQQSSKDKVFRVRDLNNILKKHGIKITNPSSLINNIVKSKNYISQVKQEGRQKYFQVTEKGEKYIKSLLSTEEK